MTISFTSRRRNCDCMSRHRGRPVSVSTRRTKELTTAIPSCWRTAMCTGGGWMRIRLVKSCVLGCHPRRVLGVHSRLPELEHAGAVGFSGKPGYSVVRERGTAVLAGAAQKSHSCGPGSTMIPARATGTAGSRSACRRPSRICRRHRTKYRCTRSSIPGTNTRRCDDTRLERTASCRCPHEAVHGGCSVGGRGGRRNV